MKTRIIHLQPTVDDHRIARYAAAAIALSVVEAAIPSPLPGVKPGLSLAGSLTSLAMLGAVLHLPSRWFGPVSQSLLAAFAHIAGQLLVARLWLVPHDGVFYLVPIFALAALVFGLVNGLTVAKMLEDSLAPVVKS